MKKRLPVRLIVVAFWILGILAPMYSFTRHSAPGRDAFDRLFQTQASHILMHAFLYAVLAYLLASMLARPGIPGGRLVLFVLLGVATVAVSQEFIQMRSEAVAFGFDEIFDVFVDLGGGAFGIAVFARFNAISQ